MAELPDLGKHCSLGECKQIDFLPIVCHFCKELYCRDHAFSENHDCPFGKQVVSERRGKIETFKCAMTSCNNRELCQLECSGCLMHHCLAHRFPNTHNCPKFELPKAYMPETTKIVQKISEKASQLTSTNKVNKNSKMALKVQLMKLKQKAVGVTSVPLDERLHFLVDYSNGKEGKAIFVSKTWSIGKAVDSAAELCDVVNNNHKSSAIKLKLYKGETSLNDEFDVKLAELIESSALENGDSLVLK